MTDSTEIPIDGLTPAAVAILAHGSDDAGTQPWRRQKRVPRARFLIAGVYPYEATFGATVIHLTRPTPRIEADAHLKSSGRARIALRSDKLGTLPYAGAVPKSDASAEELRDAFVAALVHAVGEPARERTRLLTGALETVVESYGLARATWRPARGFLPDRKGAGGLASGQLATKTFDPARFAKPIRIARGHSLRSLPILFISARQMSAHERLDRISGLIDGFAAHGIDIAAWWDELHVSV